MLTQLPASWISLSVSDAVASITINGKKIPQKSYLPSGCFPVFDQGQEYIGGYTNDSSKVVDCQLPIVVFGDHTRAIKYVNTPFAPGADGVKILQPYGFFNPKLFTYFVRYIVTKLPNHGYARHYQHLAKTLIPLPPEEEQHRIVAKIEELFSELDKGIESLKTAQAQLKVYRQALLKHAFEGKLTAQWRADNPDKLETADALLKRIQKEREQRYQQQVAEWNAGGKKGIKPRSPKPMPELSPEEVSNLSTPPDGWSWTRIGEICDCLDSLRVPINKSERANRNGPIPYYGANGQVGWIDDFLFDEPLVLVVEDETFTGREKPFSYKIDGKTWVNNHAHILRPLPGINIDYLNFQLSYYPFTARTTGTTGRKKLTQDALVTAPIRVCSVDEQAEIVSIVEAKLSESQQLEQTISTVMRQAEALRQSILKKAFSGQLVPQDPTDEPASVLLARIRAEQSAAPKAKKARK